MSNPIPHIVVGLGVAVSAFPIVAVAGPMPAPPAARSAQGIGTPAVPAPAEGSAAAPPMSAASPEGEATTPSQTVLLMKDGNVRVFDRPATEASDAYVVSMGIGEVRVPKDQVEGHFGSMREAYEYQRDHLPDRDPDEHLRLARWCLSHGMETEAAEQLRALLSWSPGDATAEAMLRNLDAAIANRAARDEGVVRTGGDSAGGMAPATEPRELHDSVLGQIRAYKGPVAAPPIFDLPEPLAVRRFQEYGATVHRVLQVHCAGCHDELSDRNFRLVRARDPKDLHNALLVRTNLDATLALVDRTNPGHSPLLINAVMPHGEPNNKKPILPNPNSPEYRAIWTWIESLRGDATAAASAPAPAPAPMTAPAPGPMPGMMPPATAPKPPAMPADPSAFGGGFATQRTGPVATGPAPAPMPSGGMMAPAPSPGMTPYPHTIDQQIQRDAVHPSVPADLDFQTVSPLLGSPDAAKLSIGGRPAPAPDPSPMPARPGAGPAAPIAPATMPTPGVVPPPANRTATGISPAPGARPGTPGTVAPPGSAATPSADPNGVVTLDDGTQILTQPDGSKMMRLPDGTLAPFMDKAAVDDSKPGRGDREIQIDPALLERLQRRKMGGP